jgi:[protein-PII] uridylyltransferase
MAQQRNLDDPATIVEFANIVKNQKNLDALMLLTLADGQGTSAENWSDWKESLVWQLYHGATQYLTNQKSYHEQNRIERDRLRASVAQLLPTDFAEEIEAHFDFMPDNYFRGYAVPEIAAHLNLFRAFLENISAVSDHPLLPSVSWEAFPKQGHTIFSICTWDRRQLLAKIAGSFSVVPLNILSADIFTRGDQVVLDVFRVCDTKGGAVTDARDLTLAEKTLASSLENDAFDFGPLIERARQEERHRLTHKLEFPTSIAIDNKAHPTYTLIQVQTPDRIGLLYELLACLGRDNVYIALSRISTQNGAAIDTFYVVDETTRAKVTESHRIEALQKHLQVAALGKMPS